MMRSIHTHTYTLLAFVFFFIGFVISAFLVPGVHGFAGFFFA